MTARMQQLIDEHLGMALHAPGVRIEPIEMQVARRHIVRALEDAREVAHPRLRLMLLRSLYRVASELGCAVCGAPIEVRELETSEMTRRSLVHLDGSCSDQLAAALEMTPDEIMKGLFWP